MAFAQDNTTTGGTSGSDNDASANYLTGPNIQRCYTDDSMTTLRRARIEVCLGSDERTGAKQACQGNKETRWSTLCNSIGTM